MLVDSHCHLDLLDVSLSEGKIDSVLANAQDNDVSHILNVCVSIDDFPQLLQTADAYGWVSASVGLHPNAQDEEVDAEKLVALGQHKKVVAVGETGLDYYRSQGDIQWQQTRFRQHIMAAKQLRKPLIIHTRAAKEDTIKILIEENAATVAGVMHCFTEDWVTAKAALELGFYISFSGIVTFKNAVHIQEVARQVPLDRILIETDAPYLAPNPKRGKQNEPGYLKHTALFLAELRNISYEDFAAATTQNFYRLFQGAESYHV